MRKFLATMLTVIMILCAMLCASACGGANAPAPSDPDTSTDPSGNENGGNGNNNNNEDKDDDPYAKYSQVLQNVLKKSHYVNLADEYKALKDSDSNRFYPHPYGLFEDLGLNVQAIKNDDLECHTRTYIKNNDKNTLYVTTRVEGVGSTPYYKCITASYSLTDKEYQDLYDMHNHYYIQAPLFIQELSYCKKANVIYNANMAKDTYDIMVEGICKSTKIKSYFDSPAFEYDFIGYDLNTAIQSNY